MERKIPKDSRVMWVLKSLLVSYVITGILLLLLAVALYKLELTEKAVSAAITVWRDHHRQACPRKKISVGTGTGDRILRPASSDHARGVPHSERRRGESGDDVHPVCRRRDGGRNAVISGIKLLRK